MPDLQTLREQRSSTVSQMRALADTAKAENRDLSDKEDAEFKQLNSDLSRTENAIQYNEILADAERSMESDSINGADFSHQCATLNYEPEGYTHWFD